jgi:electron transfer flavoprotein beta subunit
LNIIVCIKQVPDPETPSAQLRIDSEKMEVVFPANASPAVSPFDMNAVEAAVRLKEQHGGTVTALSLGTEFALDVVKKGTLAIGADELILLDDEALLGGDSFSTAYALAKAIEKIGEYDVILTGRQASDWDAGQVSSGIAEILGLPIISIAQKIESADGKFMVERVMPDGHEVFEVPTPCVISVSNELGEPRYPAMKGIMAAARKQPVTWTADDIGADASSIGTVGARTKMVRLFQPVITAECEIVEGEDEAEAGTNLALKLQQDSII